MTLSEQDLISFKSSLKQGYGFTKSCGYIMADIVEMSKLVRDDSDFKELCLECIKVHIRALLAVGQKHLQELDFASFMRQNMIMTRYVGNLNIWEDYTTKDKLTTDMFMKAVYLYRYPEEVATACGMTYIEMYDFIKNDKFLANYLTKVKWIT